MNHGVLQWNKKQVRLDSLASVNAAIPPTHKYLITLIIPYYCHDVIVIRPSLEICVCMREAILRQLEREGLPLEVGWFNEGTEWKFYNAGAASQTVIQYTLITYDPAIYKAYEDWWIEIRARLYSCH
jgi:hypothetical protein